MVLYLLLTFFGALILFVFVYLLRPPKHGPNFPPGPKGIPFFGNLFELDFVSFYDALYKQSVIYGEVMHIRLFNVVIFVLSGYKQMKEVLSKMEAASRPTGFPYSSFHSGSYGLTFSNGKQFVDQRRFTLKLFRDLGLGRSIMEDKIIFELGELIKTLGKDADSGKAVALGLPLEAAVFNAVWSTLAGKRFHQDDPEFVDLNYTMTQMFQHVTVFAGFVSVFPFLSKFIPEKWLITKVMRKAFNRADGMAQAAIDQHKATYDESNIRDFIDIYLREIKLQEKKPDSTFHEWQLVSILTDILYAGFESTAITVKWGVCLLASHPETQAKFQAEIDAVIGARSPSMSDAPQMPFSQAVCAEVQRVGSIIPLSVSHMTTADVKVDGYVIPNGSTIISNIYALHRSPKHWKKPFDFYPEHFIRPDGSFDSDKEGFLPFSIGKRQCTGEAIAKIEAFQFIVTLAQHFSFKLDDPSAYDLTKPEKGKESIRANPYFKVIIKRRH